MRLAPALALATLLAAGPAFAQDATTPAAPAEPAPATPAEPAPATPSEPAPATPGAPTEPVAAPDVATIGPNADRDFWCALAYSLTARAAQIEGDEALAIAEAAKSQILFAGLVTTMQAGGFGEAQFNALTAQYTVALLDPFIAPPYTREQCEAAVPEAKAVVDAAQAETPAPADPATPDAPASDAPATDAPATDAPATDAPSTDAPAAQ